MKKSLLAVTLFAGLGLFTATAASATAYNSKDKLTVQMQLLDPVKGNQDIGTVDITESPYGLVFTPHLKDLSAGLHGFHIHENGSCEPKEKDGKLVAGLGAGGHWDPNNTKAHGAPWDDNSHLGDLPALAVNADGTATNPVLAPRLKSLQDIKGHALMIHAGGDNHSDHPAPLGGGGARLACGLIKS
ncbi:superoxide dismutase [Mergibacter septicus]|uniref:superoxide dismutase [Cu-Zn] SodC n=1 Tax=Mergibacter septicus TaxID=221402 RepID=UPI001C78FA73|nr:superoxide dismutase [Cu-Zn] SodC [Mergibacter septicus]QDJ13218.1 superoxide dismutase [Mergibacter septicus]